MTIHHRQVHARLHAASSILSDLVDRLPRATHAATLAIIEPTDDDRPRAEDAGIRSKGAITDPTGDTAIGQGIRRDHIMGNLADQLDSLALTLSLLMAFAERWTQPTTIAGGDHRRCGEFTPRPDTIADWFDATCDRPAMGRGSGGSWHWDSHGLCEACYQRRRRHMKAIDEAA